MKSFYSTAVVITSQLKTPSGTRGKCGENKINPLALVANTRWPWRISFVSDHKESFNPLFYTFLFCNRAFSLLFSLILFCRVVTFQRSFVRKFSLSPPQKILKKKWNLRRENQGNVREREVGIVHSDRRGKRPKFLLISFSSGGLTSSRTPVCVNGRAAILSFQLNFRLLSQLQNFLSSLKRSQLTAVPFTSSLERRTTWSVPSIVKPWVA